MSSLNFDDIFNDLSGTDFEEIPVDIEEFVTSDKYLNMGDTPLSEYQYQLIRVSSQIYHKDTLISLYGEVEGQRKFKEETVSEVIAALGKGNFSPNQKFYSVDKGYVDSHSLVGDGWWCDSREKIQPAYPFFDEGPDAIYRVTTSKGYSFDCGPNHPTPVWKNTKHHKGYTLSKPSKMIKAKHMEPGDLVELKVGWSEQFVPYNVTADEARLIGYMIGDGTFVRRHNRRDSGKWDYRNATFTNATEEVQNDIVRIIESLGGSVTYTSSGSGCWQIRINGITKRLVELGLVQEYGAQKPWNDEWLSMTKANMLELIKGVYATDGWISFSKANTGRRGKNPSCMSGVEMTSESCVKGLHLALLKIGVVSKFTNHRTQRGDASQHSPTFRVCTTSTYQTHKLVSLLGDVPGKSSQVDELMSMDNIKDTVNDNYDRIKSVEYLGEFETTVCTTVAEEGVLNAGGIITSNSGKDFVSTIACAYVAYLLLCLKDPAKYYNKPAGDNIDIVNIAVNSAQANNVFFKNFKKRIEGSPWFKGKYTHKSGEIHFDKSVSAYSGHSEREAFEGLNVIYVILDEISAFAMTNNSGNESAKTAQATYDMWRASVTSRFPDEGKLVLLSFPRHANDFIMTRYNAVVAEKEVVTRTHTFKLDPDLPDGAGGNEFDIEWEEDHIVAYKVPKVWALKRPSWEVNPTKKIDDYVRDFYEFPDVALSRFAAMPPLSEGGLFRDPKKVSEALSGMNMIIPSTGVWMETFRPDPNKVYYVHADLAQKVDRCAVAIAHVDRWTARSVGGQVTDAAPHVVVDALRYWTPTRDEMVDLAEVREFLMSLPARGFNIGMVTFDRYALGTDMITYLRSRGVRADTQSVMNEEYMHFAGMVAENRVSAPEDDILKKELLELRIFPNGKIDHPRSGGKDTADAVAGAVYNAASLTRRDAGAEIEVVTLSDFTRTEVVPEDKVAGPIRNPNAGPAPKAMEDFLASMRLL